MSERCLFVYTTIYYILQAPEIKLSQTGQYLRAASDSVRDQVLRHDPSTGVFGAAYRDQLVWFNVQDAFLDSNVSDDGLTRAFTHMSIRCNPGAPDHVSEKFMQQFYAQDPDTVDLHRQTRDSKAKIKSEHKFSKQASKKDQIGYQDLHKQLASAKKSLKKEIDDAKRTDCFFSIHNEMMKRQLERQQNPVVLKTTKWMSSPSIHTSFQNEHNYSSCFVISLEI
ncbi:hypothetical protein BJ878DRAFT_575317 [Calycina marina]|uniref:Uncharacterized protein n=1 Tax=Calycina marina TaxID=1763456 RepID=A0A9P7Z3H6_9HELO|nr:hypothetical protein BJ878DRAFT_575317 [Calycina marina]